MLSREFGGIQQSFLDYNKLIDILGHEVIAVTAKGACVNKDIRIKNFQIPNYCSFDPISKFILSRKIALETPNIILAHGARAVNFSYSAISFVNKKPILIGVAHNYWIKSLMKCDYIFSITEDLKNFLANKGYNPANIFLMPNSIDVNSYNFEKKHSDFTKKINIGVLARFVHKKGVDVFIKAIAILKNKNINISATIGGDGEDRAGLEMLAANLNIREIVTFCGWVNDKKDFFKNIDIFCVPSRDEPFGIIILEAALSKTPMVLTNTIGGSEILGKVGDIELVDTDSPEKIADAIENFIKNKHYRDTCVDNAFLRVTENYDIKNNAERLQNHINRIKENVF